MEFDILTIFPNILDSYFKETIIKRAVKKRLIQIQMHNIRDFTVDKHHTVDDRPYGGGPGMIFKLEPIFRALKKINRRKKSKIVLLTPTGKQFTQQKAKSYAKLDQLILIAGRYEGVDARVEKLVSEKISIGPYVLSGGELPAAVIIEAVARLIPGVLGHEDSAKSDSFTINKEYLEYPQYTRPVKFKNWPVPTILLSGNHKSIELWRNKNSKKARKKRKK
ncbi:MAG: tRNA (guanosine(37)-N1)-methyltransferase TrmD [Candidatus Kerfeldbacteria bacterium CG_4_10_14_0_8_um_filter_42_10]|uniref:tRNA (guanine-N(1)-)-methyltransferase n=1 Tax=Candidatus Kerfeldbacteria bacterium CG_4_10_14_0_8_um_filter_42_10 TaxID=2014248 RepID=A0A2M7RJM5_9BACT|nr:MAG: tRNA (guanosine(37)-N1)-methyltransferase TrmD [Candidatus Kerfeldbacteria bacterium CG_4_10_14_0_8_um_filter_42_10]